ncbi:MAG: WYL domain-containing protein [Chloroflexi bacterium]|nr:WYL domain-containing protein [Chloroflexota bacterium]
MVPYRIRDVFADQTALEGTERPRPRPWARGRNRAEAEPHERRRMAAERFRRIWQMVEHIAAHPGASRKQLARDYSLSERQIQDDLNVIRADMRLPLVRHQGYRFRSDPPEGASSQPFTLAEAQLLLMLLRKATHDPALPGARLVTVLGKLPTLFPAHLRPLVLKTLEAMAEDASGARQEVFGTVADALLRKRYVKLHYAGGDPLSGIAEPVVQPEVLFPYLESWYLIGMCRQRRRMMIFDLDGIMGVTQATEL